MSKLKHAWRAGFCDAIFGRECISPEIGFLAQSSYVRGYMAGQDSGVSFPMPESPESELSARSVLPSYLLPQQASHKD